ncbi:response regulator [Candidatus Woesearchaeota archaeon]|jgi:CheY-like chemotaxis protein|nr:response regulator [Candidatus Woesearchaeota archaeon]MBT7705915.1 response regulator [archaeon]
MVKKILVVDDSMEDMDKIRVMLSDEECEIFSVDNGADAIDLAGEEEIDLVLLDIKMPTLSGYDLARLLRERYDGSFKIIYSSIIPQKEANMESVDGFIQKPFSKETLIHQIKGALE